MRSQAGGAAVIPIQEAGPSLGQAEQTQGVPRRSRVEDEVVVGFGVVGQECREFIERGDLRGAGAGELLAHGRQFLRAGTRAHLRKNPLAI